MVRVRQTAGVGSPIVGERPVGATRPRTVLDLAFAALACWAAAGCSTIPTTANPLVPTRNRVESGPYVIFTNAPLAPDAPEVAQLLALRRQVEQTLGLRIDPGGSPIEIYILDDRKTFNHFMTYYYPELPPRRAFFFAQGPRRVVYAFRGERLDVDLRHEATHALLNAAIVEMPLWLDEGLAEYFEVPESAGGRNAEHLAKLPGDVADGWRPDLARLERLDDVRRMSPRDYREAWAWVHYLLHGDPEGRAALAGYLAELRAGAAPSSLAARLAGLRGGAADRMVAHLEDVRSGRPIASRPMIVEDLRLQNDPLLPSEAPPKLRRGFFGRLADFVAGRSARGRD
jgi:hypothetical protein